MKKIGMYKKPNGKFMRVEFDNNLEMLQKIIKGNIEFVDLGNGYEVIVNEEALIFNQEYNFTVGIVNDDNEVIHHTHLHGIALIVKTDINKEIINLEDSDIDILMENNLFMREAV